MLYYFIFLLVSEYGCETCPKVPKWQMTCYCCVQVDHVQTSGAALLSSARLRLGFHPGSLLLGSARAIRYWGGEGEGSTTSAFWADLRLGFVILVIPPDGRPGQANTSGHLWELCQRDTSAAQQVTQGNRHLIVNSETEPSGFKFRDIADLFVFRDRVNLWIWRLTSFIYSPDLCLNIFKITLHSVLPFLRRMSDE